MARLFSDESSEYLSVDGAPVTAAPLTMAVWFRADEIDALTFYIPFTVEDKDTDTDSWGLALNGNTGVIRATVLAGGTPQTVETTNTASLNTWYCAILRDSGTAISAQLGTTAPASNAHSLSPSGVDRVAIGASADATPGGYFSGRLAEAAIWNVYLSDDECNSLARGEPPTRIRRSALKGYWPLGYSRAAQLDSLVQESDGTSKFTLEDGSGSIILEASSASVTEPDFSGNGLHMTINGTSIADHAPIAPAWGLDDFWQPYAAAAAVAAFYPGIGLIGGVTSSRWKQLAG